MSISIFEYSHACMDSLKHRLIQMRVFDMTTIWGDIDRAYVVNLLIEFMMLNAEGFISWYR